VVKRGSKLAEILEVSHQEVRSHNWGNHLCLYAVTKS
jgi:hypothetical protein